MHRSGRLRLRPWLEEQIESGKYPGVTWLDQSAQIFQIPWRHAARHGWSIDQDATLFRSWAMHTGRYRLGRDKPDPKTWKANFRCALNSLTDVCELQDRSRKRGHLASRVYRMLPPTTPQTTPPRTRMHNTGRTDRFMQQIYHYGFMVNLSVSMDEGICYIMSMLIQMVYEEDNHWGSNPAYLFSRWTQLPVGYRTGRTFVAARSTNETQAVQPTPASPSSSTNPNPAERNTSALELWGGRNDQQEQTEAVFKLMDHFNSTELWDQTGEQNGWRAYTQRNHWHCDSEDFLQTHYSDIYPCWTESSNSIGQQHCDKAVGTDWSTPQ
ncbi:uncharacterized protein LOC115558938 [Gadus morhua]|uniref:uncharacterized protein LOC115558938 n=1 Tax=Gadus morhua TaxID=8049 RepID=UPI0011B66773|nr:uncharacterized protein LOC115558938 [Gadus morhua]